MNIESRIAFLSDGHKGEQLNQIKIRISELDLMPKYPVINIAGTNGKGSVAHALSHCLKRTPYKVGRFTSPHLFKYNERIAIDEAPVDDKVLHRALDLLESLIKQNELNYYQWTFLLCLSVFKTEGVNFGVFEIGLGGRLDCGNALDPVLSVLTLVDLDHTEVLGKTRDEIGYEKVCIARPGKPFICGDINPPETVFNYLNKHQVPAYFINTDFDPLNGCNIHPNNAGVAKKVLELLSLEYDLKKVRFDDLNEVPIIGRQHVEKRFCRIVLDVAHNPSSVERLCEFIKGMHKKGRIHAVFSARSTKDIEKMLDLARVVVDEWHIAPLSNQESVLDRVLTKLTRSNTNLYPSIRRAFEGAKERCQKEDILVCFGSFQLVAEVLKLLR